MAYNLHGEHTLHGYDLHGNIPTTDNAHNQADDVVIYTNQIGYDSSRPKIATVTNVMDGIFTVHDNSTDEVVFNGTVHYEKADFSALTASGEYYIKVGEVESYPFKVSSTQLIDVLMPVAARCMEQIRQDSFTDFCATGIAFHDSHQFSFEVQSLALMYMANPQYWESLPWNVYKCNECEYPELRTQDCPNIIWLIKFAVMRYYKWSTEGTTHRKNPDTYIYHAAYGDQTMHGSGEPASVLMKPHCLIKEQVAWFLWLYPHISQYVDAGWYNTIRNWVMSLWGKNECNIAWYETTGENHNLFATQTAIGTVKGMYPPAHAVIPNFLMADVCARHNIDGAAYRNAAIANLTHIVNSVNMLAPSNNKGQRMNMYIGYENLCLAYLLYPQHCPDGTYALLKDCAKNLITRSYNKWDYVQHSTKGDFSGAAETVWVNGEPTKPPAYGNGLADIPGTVSGMSGICYMLMRVLKGDEETEIFQRLQELAVSHLDHCFGRNPVGRCFDYRATDDFADAKANWGERQLFTPPTLDGIVGIMDGAPKEEQYPYNPTWMSSNKWTYDGRENIPYGYSEGWVAFQTPWNTSLAFLMAEDSENGIEMFARS